MCSGGSASIDADVSWAIRNSPTTTGQGSVMSSFLLKESEICAALRILFPDMEKDGEILETLELRELKSAYRKKALRIQPDTVASCREEYRKGCSETFIEVKNAYETLNNYLKSKAGGFNSRRQEPETGLCSTVHWQFGSRQLDPAAHTEIGFHAFIRRSFCQTDVPRRQLRFGEFLYYSGLIPWQTLTRALVWQRKNRPRIGQIAQRWRWLTEVQVVSLLRNRRQGDFLGTLLVHDKIISPLQLSTLLWRQKKFQRPIGKYFLVQRLLTERQIRDCLLRQRIHNLQ